MAVQDITHDYYLAVIAFPFIIGSMCDSLVFFGIGVEKLIAIMKPLHYEAIVTKKRITLYVIITSLISSTLGAAPFLCPIIHLQMQRCRHLNKVRLSHNLHWET